VQGGAGSAVTSRMGLGVVITAALCITHVILVKPHPAQSERKGQMASRAEIKCINKDDRQNPYERITHVGGFVNSRWKITQQDAVGKIDRGEWEFYVSQNSRTVEVEVAVSRFGNRYLKTEADDNEPNNLLSLPECPRS